MRQTVVTIKDITYSRVWSNVWATNSSECEIIEPTETGNSYRKAKINLTGFNSEDIDVGWRGRVLCGSWQAEATLWPLAAAGTRPNTLILPGPFCPNRALLLLTPAHRSVPKDQDQDVLIRPRDLECSTEQRSEWQENILIGSSAGRLKSQCIGSVNLKLWSSHCFELWPLSHILTNQILTELHCMALTWKKKIV